MNWPDICILLLTYDRLDYAQRTLNALGNLQYSGRLTLHVADDGSPEGYVQRLLPTWPALVGTEISCVSQTNSERGGYGRNYNLALQKVHPAYEIVLPLEDDWELQRQLDLDPLVRALRESEVGCIRMGYVGYTQPLSGEFRYVAEHHYLLLDAASLEPHVWAGHPRLETREWQRAVGPWPEGLDPGSTEFTVAQRPEARSGVAWPLDLIHPRGDLWAHIGTRQARTDQREQVSA